MRPEPGAGANEVIRTDIERRTENILSLFTDLENITLPAISLESLFERQSHFFGVTGGSVYD